MISDIEFVLFVSNQEKSTVFYKRLLNIKPSLNVPGMTEYILGTGVKLGLMPNDGIANIITPVALHPREGNGKPRCELYLKVDKPQEYIARGLDLGAIEVSPLKSRDWGDDVGYIMDMDGHIIAFAK